MQTYFVHEPPLCVWHTPKCVRKIPVVWSHKNTAQTRKVKKKKLALQWQTGRSPTTELDSFHGVFYFFPEQPIFCLQVSLRSPSTELDSFHGVFYFFPEQPIFFVYKFLSGLPSCIVTWPGSVHLLSQSSSGVVDGRLHLVAGSADVTLT